MPNKKARIKDIAKLAGVSIGTVDRVLHQRGEVAEKTLLKVQKILEETSYSPNLMAQVLKSNKRYHIVSLLPGPSEHNLFWNRHPLGMTRAINELGHFPVTLTQVTFDIFSEDDFQKKTETVFDLNPDGVLLAPIFKSESSVFCSRLQNSGIPFVFIDGIVEETGYLAYVGENTFQSGRVAAGLISMITPPDLDILIVTIARNFKNVHHLSRRSEGFLDYFAGSESKHGKIINITIPEPSAESIRTSLDDLLAGNQKPGSVFITGSRSYQIAEYLINRRLTNINLIGYDLIEPNVKYLKQGYTKFLIGQRPEEQTYQGIRKLFDFLYLRRVPEKKEYLPVDIITSENVDFFLKQNQYLK
jgi:LacI family transcriptional regulator